MSSSTVASGLGAAAAAEWRQWCGCAASPGADVAAVSSLQGDGFGVEPEPVIIVLDSHLSGAVPKTGRGWASSAQRWLCLTSHSWEARCSWNGLPIEGAFTDQHDYDRPAAP